MRNCKVRNEKMRKERAEMKVICNRAGEKGCVKWCDHREPHERIDYSYGEYCTNWETCYAFDPDKKVRCVKVR